MRRGGRKLSRRMSELIGIFGDENARVIGQTSDVAFREDTNLSSLSSIFASLSSNINISTKSSKKTENDQSINYNHVRDKALFIDEKTLSAGCDWPIGIISNYLQTNENRVCRKRKFGGDGDGGSGGVTKKVRVDGLAILEL